MRRLVSILLVFSITLGALPAISFAALRDMMDYESSAWGTAQDQGANFDGIYMPEAVNNGFIAPITGETPADAVHIQTWEELAAIGGSGSTGIYYVLDNDIELISPWTPIMDFGGTLDGRGYSVTNLDVSDVNNAGLFGHTDYDMTVKNLAVEIAEQELSSWSHSDGNAGGIAGRVGTTQGDTLKNAVLTIQNCYVLGDIAGSAHAGGLVGFGTSVVIEDSYFSGNITIDSTTNYYCYAGGLIGSTPGANSLHDFYAQITNSYALGGISVNLEASQNNYAYSASAGGLIGSTARLTLENSYSNTQITLDTNATGNNVSPGSGTGGLAGSFSSGTMINSYALGSITVTSDTNASGTTDSAGGLVGSGSSTNIKNCYSESEIAVISAQNTASAGGLVGASSAFRGDSFDMENSHAKGNVQAKSQKNHAYAGGILGNTYSGSSSVVIKNSYAQGNVFASSLDAYAGGIAGYISGSSSSPEKTISVSNSSAKGNVKASSDGEYNHAKTYAGGIIGFGDGYSSIEVEVCTASGDIEAISHTRIDVRTQNNTCAGGIIGGGRYISIGGSAVSGNVLAQAETDYDTTNSYYNELICAGGLVGYGNNVLIQESRANGDVSAISPDYFAYAGGLLAYATFTNTEDDRIYIYDSSYSEKTVLAKSSSWASAGGLVSYSCVVTDVTKSFATGQVLASGEATIAGGLIGHSEHPDGTLIKDSYSSLSVHTSNGYNSNAAGLLATAYNSGNAHIINSYSLSSISSDCETVYIGGLMAYGLATIENSYAAGTLSVQGTEYGHFGGLISLSNEVEISNSYAMCRIVANEDAHETRVVCGGLVGSAPVIEISNSYSACTFALDGEFEAKGIVLGNSMENTTITNVYYDMDLSRCEDDDFGTPKTTGEMINAATYTGFNFTDIWSISPAINNGYPHLQDLLESYDDEESLGVITIKVPDEDYEVYEGYTVRLTATGYERSTSIAQGEAAFNLLDKTLTYKAELLSPIGVPFGVIDNIGLNSDSAVTKSFSGLPEPKTFTVTVKVPAGTIENPFEEELTSGYSVNWYMDGKIELLATDNTIGGLLPGINLQYEIILTEETWSNYAEPGRTKVTVLGDNNANVDTIVLVPLLPVDIKGLVKYGESSIEGAKVTITSGFAMESPTVKEVLTNEIGAFSTEAYIGKVNVHVSKFGYLDYNRSIAVTAAGSIPDVELVKNNGLTVNLAMTYTPSISAEADSPAVASSLNSTKNIEFTLYNNTREANIADFNLSGMSLVIDSASVDLDDKITVTARDASGIMASTSGKFTVNRERNSVELDFLQNGYWDISGYSSGNSSIMALLYDSTGRYISTHYPNRGIFTGDLLQPGDYSLVVIGRSQLIRQLGTLSDYGKIGLKKDTDYLLETFTVKPGLVNAYTSLSIPALDETKLYYTDMKNTSVAANKTDTIVGALVLMRASYSFEAKYAGAINKAAITVAIPSDCDFVEKSVTLNGREVDYEKKQDGGLTSITVQSTYVEGVVRLYVVPKTPIVHTINAFIDFSYMGDNITQPIGTANIKAGSLSINVPQKTGRKDVVISGTADPYSTVTVYDNGVPSGTETTSNAVGTWQKIIKLTDPGVYSHHEIYAQAKNQEQYSVKSETKELIYNENITEVSKITMIYHGTTIVFDLINPSTVVPFYSFNPSYPSFTFMAEFTNNDTDINEVNIITQDRDGNYTSIPTIYDINKNAWIGTYEFDSYTLPVWVGAEFASLETIQLDSKWLKELDDIINDDTDGLSLPEDVSADEILGVTEEEFKALTDAEFFELLLAFNEESAYMAEDINDAIDLYYETIGYNPEEDPNTISLGGFAISFGDCSEYDEETLLEEGYEIQEDTSGAKLYYKSTDTEIIILDFNRDTSQVITQDPVLVAAVQRVKAFSATTYSSKAERDQALENLKFAVQQVQAKSAEISIFLTEQLNKLDSLSDKLSNETLRLWERDEMCKDLIRKFLKMRNPNAPDKQIEEMIERTLDEYAKNDKWIKKAKPITTALAKGQAFIKGGAKALGAFGKIAGKAVPFLSMLADGYKTYQQAVDVVDAAKMVDYCCLGGCPMTENIDAMNEELTSVAIFIINYYATKVMVDLGVTYGMIAAAVPSAGTSLVPLVAYGVAMFGFDEKQSGNIIKRIGNVYGMLNACMMACKNTPLESSKNSAQPKGAGGKMTAILDPSGYVYEAVESNRLQGVKATVYYSKDADGSGKIEWKASDYDQENPLYTDVDGKYAWDVPVGYWQVEYEKDGYVTTQSDWLPVPPPQTEVNIPMESKVPPTVKSVVAYENYIEIVFDKYMDASLLTAENISLPGYSKSYAVASANEEASPQGKAYATIVRVMPLEGGFAMGQTINLAINKAVKSYAGISMQADYNKGVSIALEPKSMGNPDSLSLNYGQSKNVSVFILPVEAGKNKNIKAVSSSPMIASVNGEAVTDSNSMAVFTINGELSGAAKITLSLENSQIAGTINVTVSLPSSEPEGPKYTITATAGEGGAATGGGIYGENETVTLIATPNEGYAFDGWYEGVSKINGAGAIYSFEVSKNRTLEARFVYSKQSGGNNETEGGSDSGGGSGGGTPLGHINVTVNGQPVAASISQDGVLTLNYTQENVKKHGDGSGVYEIDIPKQQEHININIPLSALDDSHLNIKTEFGTLYIPNDALKALREKYGDILRIVIVKGSFKIALMDKNEKEISYSDLDNPFTVTLPYSLTDGEKEQAVVAVKKDGKTIVFGVYKNGSVAFEISETGIYDVIYNEKSFNDTNDHWAIDYIDFVAARNLFVGDNSGGFIPNGSMTRAMLCQVLSNLAGADLSMYTAAIFTDVSASAWYGPCVEWAANEGIAAGIGNGEFHPNDNITREQLAVMLNNYIKPRKILLPANAEPNPFYDEDSISPWALNAVKEIQKSGIISGKPGNIFDPKATATRAEVAAILSRLIKAVSK